MGLQADPFHRFLRQYGSEHINVTGLIFNDRPSKRGVDPPVACEPGTAQSRYAACPGTALDEIVSASGAILGQNSCRTFWWGA